MHELANVFTQAVSMVYFGVQKRLGTGVFEAMYLMKAYKDAPGYVDAL